MHSLSWLAVVQAASRGTIVVVSSSSVNQANPPDASLGVPACSASDANEEAACTVSLGSQ